VEEGPAEDWGKGGVIVDWPSCRGGMTKAARAVEDVDMLRLRDCSYTEGWY
jgi:hypothetical protein